MKITGWVFAAALGLISAGAVATARADVYIPKETRQAVIKPVKSAEDAITQVPGFAKIPHSFFVGDGFKFKLSGTELRIDHMATHSRAPVARRNCMISLNVASPVAFFGSSMELPLVSAQAINSGWGMSSLGDYVLHFSKDASVDSPTFGLRVSARF